MTVSTSDQPYLGALDPSSVQPTIMTRTIDSGLSSSIDLQSIKETTMDISKKVEGFIDLEILGKIKCTLNESTDPDDVDLATWIQKEYLFKPIGQYEDGRPIRSREGFEKLDRAYKRVRLLTNRAQDKWPFFDRHWKKMPPNTVRQVAHGISAMNGMLLGPFHFLRLRALFRPNYGFGTWQTMVPSVKP